MSSAGAALSNQDLEDLNEIRSRLPQGDPRASKILTLVGQHAQEPTQFERERAPSEGSVLERGASGAWSGLKAMNPFQGGFKGALENAGEMASGVAIPHAIANAYQGYKEGRNQGQGVLPSIAGAVGGATGLDVSGIRERAAKGDVAGVVGEGIPAVASTLAAPEIGKVDEAAKEGAQSLGKSMRDPYTQKLTPRTQAAAKLLGGAAGSVTGAVTGGPWGAVSGGYAGYRAMPSLAELLVPKQDVGQFSKIPERMPKPAVPPTNVPELGTPENPGFFAKLPTRMPRTASAAPTKLPSTFMMTAPEPQRMAAMPQIGGEGSTGATITPTTPKNISFVGPGDKIAAPAAPEPSRIQLPGSPAPEQKVTFQSYPREQLRQMISDPSTPYAAKMQALAELKRSPANVGLPPNAKFMMEPSAGIKPWRNYEGPGTVSDFRKPLPQNPVVAAAQETAPSELPSIGGKQEFIPPPTAPAGPALPPSQEPGPFKKASEATARPTFDSLAPQDQQWIRQWAKDMKSLPKTLLDSEMQELEGYGKKGTPIIEKIAKRMIDQKNTPIPTEAGEREDNPQSASAEAQRAQMNRKQSQKSRDFGRMKQRYSDREQER